MPTSELGEVATAEQCADRLARVPWEGAATYVLWNRLTGEPIYCGTAKSKGRLKSHLKKNDPRSIPSKHNLVNPELTRYWQAQNHDWLGVSFRLYATEMEAKEAERRIIAALGIRKTGGKLFNQRMSG